jgi:tagatose 1,6-diphosphate aldolase
MTNEISIGKLRGLQQCSTSKGVIALLALDHRQNLRKALHPAQPEKTTDQDLIDFKAAIIANLAPAGSSILLDPQFSAAQAIEGSYLPGNIGLVLALEETGYTGDAHSRQSNILDGWNVKKAKRMGASAVKLLVYYHPDAPVSTRIRDLVRSVGQQCEEDDLAYFIEPLTYSASSPNSKLDAGERCEVILQNARDLTPLGADILKVEFPLDVSVDKDEAEWLEACQKLTKASAIPWVLLSASVDYETYLKQVDTACTVGACGVAAGRAVWQEAVGMQGQALVGFLRTTAFERMRKIRELCDRKARPWESAFSMPHSRPDWYRSYPG